jgi:hypothetical protein
MIWVLLYQILVQMSGALFVDVTCGVHDRADAADWPWLRTGAPALVGVSLSICLVGSVVQLVIWLLFSLSLILLSLSLSCSFSPGLALLPYHSVCLPVRDWDRPRLHNERLRQEGIENRNNQGAGTNLLVIKWSRCHLSVESRRLI